MLYDFFFYEICRGVRKVVEVDFDAAEQTPSSKCRSLE